jgi:hypothetical protein
VSQGLARLGSPWVVPSTLTLIVPAASLTGVSATSTRSSRAIAAFTSAGSRLAEPGSTSTRRRHWHWPLAARWDHTCALMTTGGVRRWGDNTSSQLGDGSARYRLTPTPVQGTCQ